MILKIKLAIAISILLLCCSPSSIVGQVVKFGHSFTIGKVESDSAEYLFSGPKVITTDADKQVYIADGSSNTIRVFDRQGHYIKSVGRRGRGPGEFLSIDHLTLDDNNNLFVLDRLSRRVSVFSSSLNDQETYSIEANFTDPFALYPLSSEDYLIFATGAGNPSDVQELAYIFGNKFREEKDNFLPIYPTFFESKESFYKSISASPNYNSTLLGSGFVAVSPEYFSGKIVVLDPTQETKVEYILGKWEKNNYNRLDWNKRNQYRNSGMRGLVFTSRGGGLAFQIKKRSNGLVGNQDYLIHFYNIVEDKKLLSKIDVYNTEGKLLATRDLTDTNLSLYKKNGKGRVGLVPKHMDEQNQIYFADYTKGIGFPVVRVVKMNIE